MQENKRAFLITKEAKRTQCINCEIEGLENNGFKTTLIGSKIYNFREKYPNKWKTFSTIIFSTIILPIVIGAILLILEYGYFIKN